MFKETPKILSPEEEKKEKEATEKLKKIGLEKERQKAFDSLAKQAEEETLSEEDFKHSDEKVKEQRDSVL